MEFTRRLRDGVRRGDITCSVRIWTQPHVKRGHRYRMGEGEIEVDSISAIELADITPELARESGFASVVDLLKIAKHGRGSNVYLSCKASADLADMLRHNAPSQFHIPKYVGNKGWIGLWLDGADIDWSVVELALREGYLLVAPKTLAHQGRRASATTKRARSRD
jgi:hypothetical protein